MSATVTSLHHYRPAPLPGAPLRTYDLAAMSRLLGWQAFDRRTVIARLRALAGADGLPLPCTRRLRGGRLCRGADAICKDSRWDAQLIDAWLHSPGPSAPAAAIPALPTGTHRAMARRAAALLSAVPL